MSSHRSEYPENKKANWLRMLLISDLHQTNFVFFPAVVESSVLARNASNYFVKLFHVRFVDLLTSRGGGDSHMKQTGMLVGNFEFNP